MHYGAIYTAHRFALSRLGRGIILARPKHDFASRLPNSLVHLKACLSSTTLSPLNLARPGRRTWGGQGNDMSALARDGSAGIGVRDCEPEEPRGQGSPDGASGSMIKG